MTKQRKLLIFLYLNLDKSGAKIFRELLTHEHNYKEEDVDKFFLENNVDESKFITYLDSDFPDDNKLNLDVNNPTLVIEKNL